jgi:pantoate--beta-alanine ligase
MKILKTISALRMWVKEHKQSGKTIGFVPTMGYFHQGHLSLMSASKQGSDVTITSIFVNPTQFGPKEDLSSYPRNLERDLEMAQSVGVDAVFIPEAEEIYPAGFETYVVTESLAQKLEGKTRPTHFRGVCTVVLKLLNLVQPEHLYMGQKDIQQCIVLQKMIRDLHVDVEMRIQPTMRESDGLAMSSRNTYLNVDERKAALVLSQSLKLADQMMKSGMQDTAGILKAMKNHIGKEPLAKLDYVEIVDDRDMEPLEKVQPAMIICMAVYIGKTRLIDNYRYS